MFKNRKEERKLKVKILRALFLNKATLKEIFMYTNVSIQILQKDILQNEKDTEVQKELQRRDEKILELQKDGKTPYKISNILEENYTFIKSRIKLMTNVFESAKKIKNEEIKKEIRKGIADFEIKIRYAIGDDELRKLKKESLKDG